MAGLLIGDVAERTGLSAPTIRYYESIGLVAPPPRSATGYRRYGESTVEELRFIKKAQGLGFSLDEIGEILKLIRAGDTPCSHVLDLSRRHLRAIEQRIRQLTRLRDQLSAEIKKWDGEREPTCRGLCQIIVNADERASNGSEVQLHIAPRSARTKSPKDGR